MKENKEEIENACLVCQKKEAVDSGMCEDCYDKASDYQEEKEIAEAEELNKEAEGVMKRAKEVF